MKKMLSIILNLSLILIWGVACQQSESAPETESFKTGAEQLVENDFGVLAGKNVGLITNHTGLVGDRHIADILHESAEVNLVALFAPEHGIRGDTRGRVDHEEDEDTGIPVYSLHGEIYSPTPEMLEEIDVLVFDIQDIGPRFYTYISTMGRAMETAAEHDISFVVLDRPNPIGGSLVEGFVREEGYQSNVGYYPIPVTHGLTVGEIANMARAEGMLKGAEDLDLQVVKMENWKREQLWPELGREWVPPSPNIPDFETALIYPGACFFEGTNISEGRGTMEPFILIGAPWADGEEIAADMNARNLPGLQFEAASFTPESITYKGMAENPKLEGVDLQGIRYVVTDMHAVRPVEAGIHLLHAFYNHAPSDEREDFFRGGRLSRLAGTERLHDMITEGRSAGDVVEQWREEVGDYDTMRRKYHLYD